MNLNSIALGYLNQDSTAHKDNSPKDKYIDLQQ